MRSLDAVGRARHRRESLVYATPIQSSIASILSTRNSVDRTLWAAGLLFREWWQCVLGIATSTLKVRMSEDRSAPRTRLVQTWRLGPASNPLRPFPRAGRRESAAKSPSRGSLAGPHAIATICNGGMRRRLCIVAIAVLSTSANSAKGSRVAWPAVEPPKIAASPSCGPSASKESW